MQSCQESVVFLAKQHSTMNLIAYLTNFKLGLVWRIRIKTVTKDSYLVSANHAQGPRFSKVPRLFGHISGDIILFVSFAVLIFIPFTTYEKTHRTE